MSKSEELLQISQELLNASREVQRLLIKVRRSQEEILPKDLRIETDDYFKAVDSADQSLGANIVIVAHIKFGLKQVQKHD